MTVTESAAARVKALPKHVHVIGDQLSDAGEGGQYDHVNPSTGTAQRSFGLAGAEDVDRAVQAAREAFPAWRRVDANARRRMLLRLAELFIERGDTLSNVCTLENGAPSQWTPLLASILPADYFEYYSGWVDKLEGAVIPVYPGNQLDYTLPEPYGVIGVLTPWNGPLAAISMKVAPALAAGNCVVLKPPELAPFSSAVFGEMCLDAGIPPGVVNVVVGGPQTGEALVSHPGVDKVTFTGSGATATKILQSAANTLKPVVLELGGKSASLIFSDADLDHAAQLAAQLPTTMSGQGCNLPTRLIVDAQVYDEVVERVAATAATFKVGDPFESDTLLGPVISAGACQRIQGVIERAASGSGARLVAGGERLGGDLGDGYFLQPTIFADVDNRSSLAQNEVFGPVLSIIKAIDEADAVRLANDVSYGLAGYIYTSNITRAHRVAAALEAGYIGINGFPMIPPNAPFGGKKQSGFGRENGRAGLMEFVSTKNVYVELEHPSP